MTTYLQLCKDLRREAGVQGTGPSTTVSQVGMYEKICIWIADAYEEINRLHDWSYLWARATPSLSSGTAEYTAAALSITDLGKVYTRKLFDTTTSTTPRLIYVSDWNILDEKTASSGPPKYWTRKPNGSLLFYPNPDATYALRLDYQRNPTRLAANADEPLIPDTKLQKIIVWKALEYYGLHNEDSSALATGQRMFAQLLSQMHEKYGEGILTSPTPLDQEARNETPELV